MTDAERKIWRAARRKMTEELIELYQEKRERRVLALGQQVGILAGVGAGMMLDELIGGLQTSIVLMEEAEWLRDELARPEEEVCGDYRMSHLALGPDGAQFCDNCSRTRTEHELQGPACAQWCYLVMRGVPSEFDGQPRCADCGLHHYRHREAS